MERQFDRFSFLINLIRKMVMLPTDCWGLILGRLDLNSLLACRETCRYFRDLVVQVINQQARVITLKVHQKPILEPETPKKYPMAYPEVVNLLAGLYRRLHLMDPQYGFIVSLYEGETWPHCSRLGQLDSVRFDYNGRTSFHHQAFSTVTSLQLKAMHRAMGGNFTTFPRLASLTLSDQSGWSFQGLSSLTSLDITGHNPTSIPEIAQLTQLRSLALRGNYDQPQGNIEQLTSLVRLTDLTLHQVDFSAELFSLLNQLPSLTSYSHDKPMNGEEEITANFPTTLRYLKIEQNGMSSAFFTSLLQLNLDTLSLRTYLSKKTVLPPVSPSLRSLALTSFTSPWTDLSPLVGLTSLALDLDKPPVHLFAGLTNLVHLTLWGREGYRFDLSSLARLQSITLQLGWLEPTTFLSAPRLRQIKCVCFYPKQRATQHCRLLECEVDGIPFLTHLQQRDIALFSVRP